MQSKELEETKRTDRRLTKLVMMADEECRKLVTLSPTPSWPQWLEKDRPARKRGPVTGY